MFVEMMPMLSGQLRVGAMGIIGIDMPACISSLKAFGVPPEVSAVLLPYWEQGMMEAIEEAREDKEGEGGK